MSFIDKLIDNVSELHYSEHVNFSISKYWLGWQSTHSPSESQTLSGQSLHSKICELIVVTSAF